MMARHAEFAHAGGGPASEESAAALGRAPRFQQNADRRGCQLFEPCTRDTSTSTAATLGAEKEKMRLSLPLWPWPWRSPEDGQRRLLSIERLAVAPTTAAQLRKFALKMLAWHCMALHGIAWHCMALHGIAWHCMALHGIAWHCMALHGMRHGAGTIWRLLGATSSDV